MIEVPIFTTITDWTREVLDVTHASISPSATSQESPSSSIVEEQYASCQEELLQAHITLDSFQN